MSVETKEVERQTCPFLWCRNVFSNQQELFEHVKMCPHLRKGEYWCSTCSKAEIFRSNIHKTGNSCRRSQKEASSCLVEGATKLFRMLGIGSVTQASRRSETMPTDPDSNSGGDVIEAEFFHVFGDDRSVSELEGRDFSAFCEPRTHPFPQNKTRAPPFQSRSCGQVQIPYQFPGKLSSRRPASNPLCTAQMQPTISSLVSDWKCE